MIKFEIKVTKDEQTPRELNFVFHHEPKPQEVEEVFKAAAREAIKAVGVAAEPWAGGPAPTVTAR